MLGPIWVDLRSNRLSYMGFFAAWAVLSPILLLHKAVGPGEMVGRMWSALCMGAGETE